MVHIVLDHMRPQPEGLGHVRLGVGARRKDRDAHFVVV